MPTTSLSDQPCGDLINGYIRETGSGPYKTYCIPVQHSEDAQSSENCPNTTGNNKREKKPKRYRLHAITVMLLLSVVFMPSTTSLYGQTILSCKIPKSYCLTREGSLYNVVHDDIYPTIVTARSNIKLHVNSTLLIDHN